MNVDEQLKIVRYIFIELPKVFDEIQDEFNKTNCETQDLLHVLEIGKLNAIEMSRITKQLKSVRKKRRELKDELEVLYEVREFVSKGYVNEHDLNTLIGKVRSIYKKRQRRTYTMRVRGDLQPLVEG